MLCGRVRASKTVSEGGVEMKKRKKKKETEREKTFDPHPQWALDEQKLTMNRRRLAVDHRWLAVDVRRQALTCL